MAGDNTTRVPFDSSGKGDKQGLRTGKAAHNYYNPLDVNGSSIKTGDIMRTRLTGGLGHATLHSKTPSSGHKFRDDQGGGHSGKGTSAHSQHDS